MWIKYINMYRVLQEVQKKINLFFSDHTALMKEPYLNFGRKFSFGELGKEMYLHRICLYNSHVDKLNEEDIEFLKQTLRKFKVDFSEERTKRFTKIVLE